MVANIKEYQKRCQLKKLNLLVKDLLEVRQFLKFFDGLNLPDYQAMIAEVPQGVETDLLSRLHQQQSVQYYGFLELKSKEAQLKEAIEKASDELDKLL